MGCENFDDTYDDIDSYPNPTEEVLSGCHSIVDAENAGVTDYDDEYVDGKPRYFGYRRSIEELRADYKDLIKDKSFNMAKILLLIKEFDGRSQTKEKIDLIEKTFRDDPTVFHRTNQIMNRPFDYVIELFDALGSEGDNIGIIGLGEIGVATEDNLDFYSYEMGHAYFNLSLYKEAADSFMIAYNIDRELFSSLDSTFPESLLKAGRFEDILRLINDDWFYPDDPELLVILKEALEELGHSKDAGKVQSFIDNEMKFASKDEREEAECWIKSLAPQENQLQNNFIIHLNTPPQTS